MNETNCYTCEMRINDRGGRYMGSDTCVICGKLSEANGNEVNKLIRLRMTEDARDGQTRRNQRAIERPDISHSLAGHQERAISRGC